MASVHNIVISTIVHNNRYYLYFPIVSYEFPYVYQLCGHEKCHERRLGGEVRPASLRFRDDLRFRKRFEMVGIDGG